MVSNGRRRRQAKPVRPIRSAVIVLVFAFVSGCSQPPEPSPETAALEASLLTVADLRDSFVEESRGQVGVSGSKLCSESDFAFEDVGMVRASFVRSLDGDDEISLVEMLRVGEPGELDAFFPALKAAYQTCAGREWKDYGETKTVELMDAPDVGDDRIAVRSGIPPFDRRLDYGRTVYVRIGDTFVEISVWETLEDGEQVSVTDEELDRIVRAAIAKLTN